jgi:hypothetical protein
MPFDLPSWFTAILRSIAYGAANRRAAPPFLDSIALAIASTSHAEMTTAPQPSPRTYPSAPLSPNRQRAVAPSIPARVKADDHSRIN